MTNSQLPHGTASQQRSGPRRRDLFCRGVVGIGIFVALRSPWRREVARQSPEGKKHVSKIKGRENLPTETRHVAIPWLKGIIYFDPT